MSFSLILFQPYRLSSTIVRPFGRFVIGVEDKKGGESAPLYWYCITGGIPFLDCALSKDICTDIQTCTIDKDICADMYRMTVCTVMETVYGIRGMITVRRGEIRRVLPYCDTAAADTAEYTILLC